MRPSDCAVAHVYTIRLVRYIEGDEYEQDRSDIELRRQVAHEIQEAQDRCGLPEGFFYVESVVSADQQTADSVLRSSDSDTGRSR